MKKGLPYGAWKFFLDLTHLADTDVDEWATPKVQFFSEWYYEGDGEKEGEFVYFKTNKNQYYFIYDFCGDDMYTMGPVCQFLWYYWMLDMSMVIFYILFMVDVATKFEFLKTWETRIQFLWLFPVEPVTEWLVTFIYQ